ncbi:anillin-like isoform X2 [Eleutherodactylus coqui]|uniref:anillin-like isoform X2 n=1 Tax=Eleutherodactylus coqui TaxID=57060 RepID=UPI0034623AB7
MEVKRQPLKRLCSDSSNESLKKRRLAAAEDGDENRDPGEQEGCSSAPPRSTEQAVKPDTPAIPSVRSRIQMFQNKGRSGGAQDIQKDSIASEKVTPGLTDAAAEETDRLAGCKDIDAAEGSECEEVMEEHPLPVACSTLASRHQLHSDNKPPSAETVRRLRQERQEELAMVCAVLDRNNPWRAASMRQLHKRARKQASEAVEPPLESRDESPSLPGDTCVSFLEVRLRRSYGSGSLDSEVPPTALCEAADQTSPEGSVPDGDEGGSTLNSSEVIDRIFEGVLNVSDASEDMDLPPVSILSPLTQSLDLQAAISPLNSVVSSLPELLMESPVTPKTSADEENHLPHSVDTYRTLMRNVQELPATPVSVVAQNHLPTRQDVDQAPGSVKEKIKILSTEVSSLQHIIEQSRCALRCCVDVEHGKGTRQEAEAERLLLLSSEKKAALLKELDHLREERSEQPSSSPVAERRPCRGSVTISDIRLPLKVDYVCSTIKDAGLTGHYFLILIRYGAYDVVATPLASAADAQTGDTIIFPTTVTLNDASSDFKVEMEVYSLAHPASALEKRKSLKPKITPKKLLPSRKSSLTSPAFSPAVSTPLRASSFLLVGSLTVSLESLGKMKFPLEKMKLEGPVGRLLRNHFQDQVPFLSPLEGSLYLKMRCRSHSSVQRSGFLTMFEDVSGLGAWHRRWCLLSEKTLSFWAYPDQVNCKEPLGRINLINCTSEKVEAAQRESCARPHTMELVTMRPQREDDTDTLVTQRRGMLCFTKIWLSADTREEKQLWMDSLNQMLLDLRTWKTSPGKVRSQV